MLAAWLMDGYALLLAAIAFLLEALARHAHRRTQHYELAGFRYHATLDFWICPEGENLHRHPSSDPFRRRYRAPAATCNRCTRKPDCTDSDEGRQLEWSLANWLETHTGRFHRGLSLALLVLASAFLLAAAALDHRPPMLVLLGGQLTLTAAAIGRLASDLKRSTAPPSACAGSAEREATAPIELPIVRR